MAGAVPLALCAGGLNEKVHDLARISRYRNWRHLTLRPHGSFMETGTKHFKMGIYAFSFCAMTYGLRLKEREVYEFAL
ncbi:MAG: hypothetical protein ACLU92_09860 [Coprococcus comes]